MASRDLTFRLVGKDVSAGKTLGAVGSKADQLGHRLSGIGKATSIALGGAVVAGVAGIGAALVQGAKDAASYQTLAAQTAAVIKSTGNAAGISVKGVQNLAGQLESLSGMDEEAIISGQNLLATFTGVQNKVGKGNDIFTQATKTIVDMSVALGQDTKSSAIQLGKALNDPLKGVTALSKVGVSFTKQQKDQIKTLVKSGKNLDAQKVILKELNKEFGGAAKAAGSGLQGSLARTKDAFGDMFRAIATPLLPKFASAAEGIAGRVAGLATALGNIAQGFRDGVTDSGGFMGAMQTVGDKARAVFDGVKEFGPRIAAAIGSGVQAVAKVVAPVIGGIAGAIQGGLDNVSPDLSSLGKKIRAGIVDSVSDVVGGVRQAVETGDWQPVGKALGEAIGTALKGAADFGKVVGNAFKGVDWVGLGIKLGKAAVPLLAGLAIGLITFDPVQLLQGLGKHWFDAVMAVLILAFIPAKAAGIIGRTLAKIPFLGRLLEWGFNAAHGFSRGMVRAVWGALRFVGREFLAGFRAIFPGIGSAFGKALALLPTRVGVVAINAAAAAKNLVLSFRDGIVSELGAVAQGIGQIVGVVLKPFARFGGLLVGAGRALISGLSRGISSTLGGFGANLAQIPGRVVAAFGDASRMLFGVGQSILRGLWDGIKSMLPWLGDRLKGVGGFIKDHKGPLPVDRVLLKPAGKAIMSGLVAGIEGGKKPLGKSLAGVTGMFNPNVRLDASQVDDRRMTSRMLTAPLAGRIPHGAQTPLGMRDYLRTPAPAVQVTLSRSRVTKSVVSEARQRGRRGHPLPFGL